MAKIRIKGDTSGYVDLQAPAVAGAGSITVPNLSGTLLTSASDSSDFPSAILTSTSNITSQAMNGPAFRAYLSSNQSISSNVTTVLQLDTETFDTDSCYDTSTYRFTPTVEGYYFAYLQVRWSVPVSQQCAFSIGIRKNGAQLASGQHDMNAGSNTDGLTFDRSLLVYMNGTTDYMDFVAYQFIYTSPQSRNVVGNSNETHAEAYFVRGA